MSLARAPENATVFRLVKTIKDHFPPGAAKPLPGALKLTKDDYEDGRSRGIAALNSVFNSGRTTIEQARTLRNQAESESTPFCWPVSVVVTIRGFDDHPLAVLLDPDRWTKGVGARGHCGISGLARGYEDAKGADKVTLKRIRSELVDACERFDAAKHPSPSAVRVLADTVGTWGARKLARGGPVNGRIAGGP